MSRNEITTAEVLNKAADLIEERGWAKGSPGMRVDGPHCALGAISSTLEVETYESAFGHVFDMSLASESEPARVLAEYVLPFIEGAIGHELERVWRWNDGKNRTVEQVVEALRACAVIAEARETSAVASTHHAGLPGAEVSA